MTELKLYVSSPKESGLMERSLNDPCLLIIDDELNVRRGMSRLLKRQGYRVRVAETGAEAERITREDAVAVAIVDVRLPDVDGAVLIQRLLASSPETICIAITGMGAASLAARLLQAGARDYFEKPIEDWTRFYNAIHQQLAVWHKERELDALRAQVQRQLLQREDDLFEAFMGNSPAVQKVFSLIRTYGPTELPVLIRGESGSGKELVAKALHDASPRASGPFVAVNCAGIPENLFESELFGQVEGAYTGAKFREGLCGTADGGTLFLDEFGELPFATQAKLLRLIENRVFRRLGADKDIKLNARVIAATNVDLSVAIREKRFRQDLYYRLSGQQIGVPSLRQRPEDIHVLAYHFLDKYNRVFNKEIRSIQPEALQKLQAHEWRGSNVRELDHEIQRAVAVCEGHVLTEDMLFQDRAPSDLESASEGDSWLTEGLLEMGYKEAMEEGAARLARWYIEHFLQETRGNQQQASELAGMQRTHLARRVKELKIKPEEFR